MKYFILCLVFFVNPLMAESLVIGLKCSVVPGIKLNNKCVYVTVTEDGYKLPDVSITLNKNSNGDYTGDWHSDAEKNGEIFGVCNVKVKKHIEAGGAYTFLFKANDFSQEGFFKIELEDLNQSIPRVKTSVLRSDCSKVQIEASLN